jgi:hypothetical protein
MTQQQQISEKTEAIAVLDTRLAMIDPQMAFAKAQIAQQRGKLVREIEKLKVVETLTPATPAMPTN